MRITTVLFILLLPLFVFGQETVDSIVPIEPEWNRKDYSQEDKIFNRSIWTFVDNPALAGFDRKLAAAYRFRMKNLSMGVPNDKGKLELAFMKHEAFVDLSTGGPKQNWGTAVYYSNEKELQHTIQHAMLASSFRINIKDHHLILGAKITFQLSKLNDWGKLTFGDMFDPRYGLVYQTNEIRPSSKSNFIYFGGGLRYYWKRFLFDYSVERKPDNGWALAQMGTNIMTNKLKAVYHFNVGDGITISPEVTGEIQSIGNNIGSGNNFGFFSAYATITYKDMAYGQLGIADLNRLSFRAGYQLKDMLVIEAGLSSYLDKTMEKIGGLAGVDVGIRYQIRPWYR
ncbi:MAG: hypothetical protein K9G46_05180 [Flavobacteriales bacterium]|nr:hypothetical protein [Flavobacteriales bacterium]